MFVVDWDGTCVEEVWPGMGDWLPGAVDSLRTLSQIGKTVIYSLRCHEYEVDDITPRAEGAPAAEAQAIRKMLDDAGLHDVEVYPNDRGKPPARYYIDDRGIRFEGDWDAVLSKVADDFVERMHSVQ
jgi:hypothetical protein